MQLYSCVTECIVIGCVVAMWVWMAVSCPHRNPDNDKKPWCYTMNNGVISWEYCDVPSCLRVSCESNCTDIISLSGIADISSLICSPLNYTHNYTPKNDFACGRNIVYGHTISDDICPVYRSKHPSQGTLEMKYL